MHTNSLKLMTAFIAEHVHDYHKILDVGSYNVNGTFRKALNAEQQGNYVGLDISAGSNVNIVPADPYSWTEIPDESFDIVISGSAFEHTEFFWLTIKEIARVVRPGGKVCIIAPARWHLHCYPVDCWRFNPDGMAAMAKWSGLKLLEGRIDGADGKNADCIGVFEKEKKE